MSSRSPRLRPLRSRSEQSITDNDTEEKIETEGEEILNNDDDDDNNPDENITMTEELNNLEFENNESTEVIHDVDDNNADEDDVDDDSDSDEPRLVIKEEEHDDNLIDDNNTVQDNRTYNCTTCESKPEFKNLVDYLQHLKEQHPQKVSNKYKRKIIFLVFKDYFKFIKEKMFIFSIAILFGNKFTFISNFVIYLFTT